MNQMNINYIETFIRNNVFMTCKLYKIDDLRYFPTCSPPLPMIYPDESIIKIDHKRPMNVLYFLNLIHVPYITTTKQKLVRLFNIRYT